MIGKSGLVLCPVALEIVSEHLSPPPSHNEEQSGINFGLQESTVTICGKIAPARTHCKWKFTLTSFGTARTTSLKSNLEPNFLTLKIRCADGVVFSEKQLPSRSNVKYFLFQDGSRSGAMRDYEGQPIRLQSWHLVARYAVAFANQLHGVSAVDSEPEKSCDIPTFGATLLFCLTDSIGRLRYHFPRNAFIFVMYHFLCFLLFITNVSPLQVSLW